MNKNFVEKTLDLIEGNIATVAVRLGSWLAPIPTSYLIFRSVQVHLAWPWQVALVAGAVIELLGMGTVNLFLTFREHNATKTRKTDPAAPALLALGLAAAYFSVVMLLTIVLEVLPAAAVISPVVFVGMSLTGAGTLMLRNDHKRRIAAIADRKAADKAEREARKANCSTGVRDSVSNVRDGVPNGFAMRNAQRAAEKAAALDATIAYVGENPGASLADIASHVGKGKSTVSGYITELQAAGTIKRNGRGLEVI